MTDADRLPDPLAGLTPTPAPMTTPAGERLLEAAEELFYWRGIGAVGVDLVAETAGVTKRTLYQRFGSKQELVAAYLQRRAGRWQSHLLSELTPLDPADRVLAVYDVSARWAREHSRGCAFVNAWAELSGTDNRVVDGVREEKRWMSDLFVALTGEVDVAAHLHLLHEGAQVTSTTLRDGDAWGRARAAAAATLTARSVHRR